MTSQKTTLDSRQGFRVKWKLKIEFPEKNDLSNRPRWYHHEA